MLHVCCRYFLIILKIISAKAALAALHIAALCSRAGGRGPVREAIFELNLGFTIITDMACILFWEVNAEHILPIF